MENTVIFAYRCFVFYLVVLFLVLLRKLPVSTTAKLLMFGGFLWLGLETMNNTVFLVLKPDIEACHAWLAPFQERFIHFGIIFFTIRLLDWIPV
jgi:hypothetical protein